MAWYILIIHVGFDVLMPKSAHKKFVFIFTYVFLWDLVEKYLYDLSTLFFSYKNTVWRQNHIYLFSLSLKRLTIFFRSVKIRYLVDKLLIVMLSGNEWIVGLMFLSLFYLNIFHIFETNYRLTKLVHCSHSSLGIW